MRRSSFSTSMNPDDIANQQELLAAHRRTLAVYLRQLTNLGANYVPPGVYNGIAEARAEIQRIKAGLRAHGESVNDAPGDEPMPEAAVPAAHPSSEACQSTEGGDHNIQAVNSTITVICQYPRPIPPRFRNAVQRMLVLRQWRIAILTSRMWLRTDLLPQQGLGIRSFECTINIQY